MTTTPTNGPAMVAAMADLVLAEAEACEQLRTTTAPVVDAVWDTGLMTWFNPSEAGGAEPSFEDMIRTWIDMARLDGSFGWVGIANLPSTAAVAALLPDAGFEAVFTDHDNRVTLGGQFFPNGTGTAVAGGYQVTGAWNFGSATGHSEYIAAGFMPMVDGEMVFPLDAKGKWAVAEGVLSVRRSGVVSSFSLGRPVMKLKPLRTGKAARSMKLPSISLAWLWRIAIRALSASCL